MKHSASKSYQIGQYVVRRDTGGSSRWRVFVQTKHGGVQVFCAQTLEAASAFAHQMCAMVRTQPTLVPANGGTEQPFTTRSGRRVLYVYDCEAGTHGYLDLGTDQMLPRDFSPLEDM